MEGLEVGRRKDEVDPGQLRWELVSLLATGLRNNLFQAPRRSDRQKVALRP